VWVHETHTHIYQVHNEIKEGNKVRLENY
jgi:hypothetical protein